MQKAVNFASNKTYFGPFSAYFGEMFSKKVVQPMQNLVLNSLSESFYDRIRSNMSFEVHQHLEK